MCRCELEQTAETSGKSLTRRWSRVFRLKCYQPRYGWCDSSTSERRRELQTAHLDSSVSLRDSHAGFIPSPPSGTVDLPGILKSSWHHRLPTARMALCHPGTHSVWLKSTLFLSLHPSALLFFPPLAVQNYVPPSRCFPQFITLRLPATNCHLLQSDDLPDRYHASVCSPLFPYLCPLPRCTLFIQPFIHSFLTRRRSFFSSCL